MPSARNRSIPELAPITATPVIRSLSELGKGVRMARQAAGMSTVALAEQSGHSRNTLHRIESGIDCSTSTLLSTLRAMGYTIEIKPLRRPTLDEVSALFGVDEEP